MSREFPSTVAEFADRLVCLAGTTNELSNTQLSEIDVPMLQVGKYSRLSPCGRSCVA